MTDTKDLSTSNVSNAQLLTEAIRFEHWARFYCMREIATNNEAQEQENILGESTTNDEGRNDKSTDDKSTSDKGASEKDISGNDTGDNPTNLVIIQVPEVLVHISNEEEPHLAPLLELIQNSEIALDSARAHILTFLQEKLELNQEDFVAEIQRLGASKKFTRYLDVFYTFVQEEADLEEKELAEKETEIGIDAMTQYLEEVPVPTFAAWTETFHQWAEKRNFRLEL